jgi:hypothetical protein
VNQTRKKFRKKKINVSPGQSVTQDDFNDDENGTNYNSPGPSHRVSEENEDLDFLVNEDLDHVLAVDSVQDTEHDILLDDLKSDDFIEVKFTKYQENPKNILWV